MKLFFLFLVASCFSILNFSAQEKIWLNAKEAVVLEENASFYRVFVIKNNKKQLATDYLISGEKARTYHFRNNKKEGLFFSFYPSGEVKVAGIYKDGLRDGVFKTYHKNGKIKQKGKYSKGEKVGVWKIFYKNE